MVRIDPRPCQVDLFADLEIIDSALLRKMDTFRTRLEHLSDTDRIVVLRAQC